MANQRSHSRFTEYESRSPKLTKGRPALLVIDAHGAHPPPIRRRIPSAHMRAPEQPGQFTPIDGEL